MLQLLRIFGISWILVLSLGVKVCHSASTSQELPASAYLFTLISQRLALMQQVALYRYNHQLPVIMPAPDNLKSFSPFCISVLEKVKEEAPKLGLPSKEAQSSIELQIRIGEYIQQQWQSYWHEKELPLNSIVSELDVLRPELARLAVMIIEQIGKSKEELLDPEHNDLLVYYIDQIIDVPFVSDEDKQVLLASLIKVAKGTF